MTGTGLKLHPQMDQVGWSQTSTRTALPGQGPGREREMAFRVRLPIQPPRIVVDGVSDHRAFYAQRK